MIFAYQFILEEKNNMSYISIIVPIYNPPAQYLRECLDSICNQTLKDIEIILVDNASTGNNPEIIAEYQQKDSRIKVIKLNQNMGYSGACNRALKILSSPYFQIVDSDDFIAPNCCQTLLSTMQKYPNCDLLLFCAYEYHNQDNTTHTTSKYDYTTLAQRFGSQPFTFNHGGRELLGSSSQAWNKFYKSSLVLNNQNFLDEDFVSFGGDTIFSYYNYLNAHEIRLLPERLYYYRYDTADSVMSKISKKSCTYFLAPIKLAHKIDLIAQKYPNHQEKFKILNLQILKIFFTRIHKDNRKAYFQCVKQYFKQNKYPKQFLKLSGTLKWYRRILKFNYFFYKLTQIFNRS